LVEWGLLEVEVELGIAGRRPMQFREIITEFQLGREKEWLSRLLDSSEEE